MSHAIAADLEAGMASGLCLYSYSVKMTFRSRNRILGSRTQVVQDHTRVFPVKFLAGDAVDDAHLSSPLRYCLVRHLLLHQ
jgi:hypothetical protein